MIRMNLRLTTRWLDDWSIILRFFSLHSQMEHPFAMQMIGACVGYTVNPSFNKLTGNAVLMIELSLGEEVVYSREQMVGRSHSCASTSESGVKNWMCFLEIQQDDTVYLSGLILTSWFLREMMHSKLNDSYLQLMAFLYQSYIRFDHFHGYETHLQMLETSKLAIWNLIRLIRVSYRIIFLNLWNGFMDWDLWYFIVIFKYLRFASRTFVDSLRLEIRRVRHLHRACAETANILIARQAYTLLQVMISFCKIFFQFQRGNL